MRIVNQTKLGILLVSLFIYYYGAIALTLKFVLCVFIINS